MPIKVACACGAAFAAKDELAGRTVKCPKCAQPLKIPASAGAAPKAPAGAAKPAAAATAQRPAAPRQPAAPSAPAAPSLFDEVGMKATVPGAPACPGCAAPLPPNAVLCIKCGYNLKLGRRMETMTTSGAAAAGGHGGHGGDAEAALERAAAALEEEVQAERSKTREGMPWWVYLIAINMVVGFMTAMMFIPKEYALRGAGATLIVAGFFVCIFAYFRVVYIAFTENIGFGIMTIVCGGLGAFIYTIMRWDRCGGYFFMSLGGNAIQWVGYGMIWAADLFVPEPGAESFRYRLPTRLPSAIVRVSDSGPALPLLRQNCGDTTSDIETKVAA